MSHKHGTGRNYVAGCADCQALKRAWSKAYLKGNEDQAAKRRARDRKYQRHLIPGVTAYVRGYNTGRYAARRVEVNAYKLEHGCYDCGLIPEFPEVLDFDHVRGQKLGDVSQILRGSYEKLWDEIAKCDVVCANCHRIRTITRKREKQSA